MREAGVASAVLCGVLSATADQKSCDVLVVGGGSAGVVAAIQAGRLGAKTILVEAGAQMGGGRPSEA
jgi:ribulose 1,5-bisphosphate synthetase/thiazole synthase